MKKPPDMAGLERKGWWKAVKRYEELWRADWRRSGILWWDCVPISAEVFVEKEEWKRRRISWMLLCDMMERVNEDEKDDERSRGYSRMIWYDMIQCINEDEEEADNHKL
jgi:hypothetical protein